MMMMIQTLMVMAKGLNYFTFPPTVYLVPQAAIEYGRILTRLTHHPVYILKGGYECFSGTYHFLRTQKIIWMPQELDAFQPYPIEIVPGKVFIGNFSQACDPKIQKDLKIKAHVNVSMDTGPFFAGDADKLLHIRIEDSPEAQILPFLRHMCHFIEVLGLCQEVQKQHVSKSGIGESAAGMGEDYPWRFHHKHHGSALLIFSAAHRRETHRLYRLKLEELTKLQNNCTSSITRQKKRLQELALALKKCKPSLPAEAEGAAQELENQMKERQGLFFDMEAYLPKKNGLYLSLVLGNVNVTLLSKQAKFAYKDEYEKFKLYLTIILILISFTCRFLLNSRVTDAAFNFLLVWYYCTLTIRESILINNGSRIKGWWVFHHYVSTFLSGVMLTWPDGLMYQKFRNQFLSFSMYQSFVQFLQYYYQSGCLYRLRALGERHTMDLTVEGFQSWMWRGLTFLLPFLFFGHFWQLFNALTLFNLARDPQCKEWQGCAPEVSQSAAREQEGLRLGLPLPAQRGFCPVCCGRGWEAPLECACIRGSLLFSLGFYGLCGP
ncbi:transmembrane protein 120A isoform X4 [Gorilla gorilla gorilla]|uniref:transmembrane protein 120A isoform X4 n=1 Tax=Gorilla gorilla gorilla TaxID=9595 RepID=UPI0024465072|nr:ion channel TACAN isoform X4 [Gorilla gorilla gorilla]